MYQDYEKWWGNATELMHIAGVMVQMTGNIRTERNETVVKKMSETPPGDHFLRS